jgi:hypothetical protein
VTELFKEKVKEIMALIIQLVGRIRDIIYEGEAEIFIAPLITMIKQIKLQINESKT